MIQTSSLGLNSPAWKTQCAGADGQPYGAGLKATVGNLGASFESSSGFSPFCSHLQFELDPAAQCDILFLLYAFRFQEFDKSSLGIKIIGEHFQLQASPTRCEAEWEVSWCRKCRPLERVFKEWRPSRSCASCWKNEFTPTGLSEIKLDSRVLSSALHELPTSTGRLDE